MDFDLGEEATTLRARLRSLIDAHIPPDFLGAFTDDPADLATTQDFCHLLADQGLLTVAWPEEYGGAGGGAGAQTGGRGEKWGHGPWCARRCGPTTSHAARSTWA